jgi:hypothetical protein
MSDWLNGYMGTRRSALLERRSRRNTLAPFVPFVSFCSKFRSLAPLRLCVSHTFCAETIRDSCNSSLQLFAKN